MKKLFCCLLCAVMIVGCGASSSSVPVKDSRFKITHQDLVSKVDKIVTGQGVPLLAGTKTINLPIESGMVDMCYVTGDAVRVALTYDEKSNEPNAINLLYDITIPQEDAASQMGRYLAAFAKVLSPNAKMKIDIAQALLNTEKTTTYVEDNMEITIQLLGGTMLQVLIEPNE